MGFLYLHSFTSVVTAEKEKSAEIPKYEIVDKYITYAGATGDVLAYMSKPVKPGIWPAIIVIHDKDGINDEIEEITKVIASHGFYVIVPDGLSQISGTPDVHDFVVSSMDHVNYDSTKRNFAAVIKFLEQDQSAKEKIGCVGFGWGKQLTRELADAYERIIIPCFPMDKEEENQEELLPRLLIFFKHNLK